ncbi:MAG: hypothetical protein ABIS67_10740 [Candidatus Eisenbacteria bacterium]
MNAQEATSRDGAGQWGWWVAAALLVALRLPHLMGPLDDPHSWRQCDTARYSLDFARNGIDLLHPAVCWLGAHRTLIFEFALPEAISALLQRWFGEGEHWDRIVALGFFLAATFYLHAFLRLAAGRRAAWLATLAWLALPLGQFYSRAAHVDFAATAGVHALLYHGARAARGAHWGHAAGAAAGGTLAALIKAPYLLPVLGPLGLIALSATGVTALAALGAALAVTMVVFKLWRGHVDAVNAQAPDWFFLPGYYKEVNPLWWYFGEWTQRFDRASWVRVVRRLVQEVATAPGVLIAFAAPFAAARTTALKAGPRALAVAWAVGTIAYLLVFFPLNVIHNYYQIPFLAPAALLIALGFEAMWDRVRWGAIAAGVLFAAMILVSPARLHYYGVDWLRIEAGYVIDARVPKGDLVVACDHSSGHSDPRLLHRADRDGWPLAIADLTPERLAKLHALGARHVAIVTSDIRPDLRAPEFLAPARVGEYPLLHWEGEVIGKLTLYSLPVP